MTTEPKVELPLPPAPATQAADTAALSKQLTQTFQDAARWAVAHDAIDFLNVLLEPFCDEVMRRYQELLAVLGPLVDDLQQQGEKSGHLLDVLEQFAQAHAKKQAYTPADQQQLEALVIAKFREYFAAYDTDTETHFKSRTFTNNQRDLVQDPVERKAAFIRQYRPWILSNPSELQARLQEVRVLDMPKKLHAYIQKIQQQKDDLEAKEIAARERLNDIGFLYETYKSEGYLADYAHHLTETERQVDSLLSGGQAGKVLQVLRCESLQAAREILTLRYALVEEEPGAVLLPNTFYVRYVNDEQLGYRILDPSGVSVEGFVSKNDLLVLLTNPLNLDRLSVRLRTIVEIAAQNGHALAIPTVPAFLPFDSERADAAAHASLLHYAQSVGSVPTLAFLIDRLRTLKQYGETVQHVRQYAQAQARLSALSHTKDVHLLRQWAAFYAHYAHGAEVEDHRLQAMFCYAQAYAVSGDVRDKENYLRIYTDKQTLPLDKDKLIAQLLQKNGCNSRVLELVRQHDCVTEALKPLKAYVLGCDLKELFVFCAQADNAHNALLDQQMLQHLLAEPNIPSGFKIKAIDQYLQCYGAQDLTAASAPAKKMLFYLRQALHVALDKNEGVLTGRSQHQRLQALAHLESCEIPETTLRIEQSWRLHQRLNMHSDFLTQDICERSQEALLQGNVFFEDGYLLPSWQDHSNASGREEAKDEKDEKKEEKKQEVKTEQVSPCWHFKEETLVDPQNSAAVFYVSDNKDSANSGFDVLNMSRETVLFELLEALSIADNLSLSRSRSASSRSSPLRSPSRKRNTQTLNERLGIDCQHLLLAGQLDEIAEPIDLQIKNAYLTAKLKQEGHHTERAAEIHRLNTILSGQAASVAKARAVEDVGMRVDILATLQQTESETKAALKKIEEAQAQLKKECDAAEAQLCSHCKSTAFLSRVIQRYIGGDGSLPLSMAHWCMEQTEIAHTFWEEDACVPGKIKPFITLASQKLDANLVQRHILVQRTQPNLIRYARLVPKKEALNANALNAISHQQWLTICLYWACREYLYLNVSEGFQPETHAPARQRILYFLAQIKENPTLQSDTIQRVLDLLDHPIVFKPGKPSVHGRRHFRLCEVLGVALPPKPVIRPAEVAPQPNLGATHKKGIGRLLPSFHKPLKPAAVLQATLDNFYDLFCRKVEQIILQPESTAECLISVMQSSPEIFSADAIPEKVDLHAILMRLQSCIGIEDSPKQMVGSTRAEQIKAREPIIKKLGILLVAHYKTQLSLIKPDAYEKFTAFLLVMVLLYSIRQEGAPKPSLWTADDLLDWLDTGPQLKIAEGFFTRIYEGEKISLIASSKKTACLNLLRRSGFVCEREGGEAAYYALQRNGSSRSPNSKKYGDKVATPQQVWTLEAEIASVRSRMSWYPGTDQDWYLTEASVPLADEAVRLSPIQSSYTPYAAMNSRKSQLSVGNSAKHPFFERRKSDLKLPASRGDSPRLGVYAEHISPWMLLSWRATLPNSRRTTLQDESGPPMAEIQLTFSAAPMAFLLPPRKGSADTVLKRKSPTPPTRPLPAGSSPIVRAKRRSSAFFGKNSSILPLIERPHP